MMPANWLAMRFQIPRCTLLAVQFITNGQLQFSVESVHTVRRASSSFGMSKHETEPSLHCALLIAFIPKNPLAKNIVIPAFAGMTVLMNFLGLCRLLNNRNAYLR